MNLRDVEIRSSDGSVTESLFYQLREEPGCRWLFIAQADNPVNPDIPQGDVKKIKVRGEYSMTIYDSMTGDILSIQTEFIDGWTCFDYLLYEHDSLLLRLAEKSANASTTQTTEKDAIIHAMPAKEIIANPFASHFVTSDSRIPQRFLAPVPITLHEQNVLLLDMAEFALDDEEYRPCEEILRLDNILRNELKWPLRGDAAAQPWVENDTSTPHTLRLRFTFNSEISILNAELALENATVTKVTLNGEKADSVSGWYVDKSIKKISIPEVAVGKNILELTVPYGKKTDIEACYLLGNFGVTVQGINCTITKPISKLTFGDITRQGLPFYGGNLTYHLEVEAVGHGDGSSVSSYCFCKEGAELLTCETGEPSPCHLLEIAIPYYRGHLLRVAVDGKDEGVIAFSPYRKAVEFLKSAENQKSGKHKIDIIYFGSRVNTFGQLHRNNRHDQWWGPDSWRSTGDAWTYEYRFWPQGVLKSPEVWL